MSICVASWSGAVVFYFCFVFDILLIFLLFAFRRAFLG